MTNTLKEVATPEDAIQQMRDAAQSCHAAIQQMRDAAQSCHAAAELQAAWQDDDAGKVWEILAYDLEAAADRAQEYWD